MPKKPFSDAAREAARALKVAGYIENVMAARAQAAKLSLFDGLDDLDEQIAAVSGIVLRVYDADATDWPLLIERLQQCVQLTYDLFVLPSRAKAAFEIFDRGVYVIDEEGEIEGYTPEGTFQKFLGNVRQAATVARRAFEMPDSVPLAAGALLHTYDALFSATD